MIAQPDIGYRLTTNRIEGRLLTLAALYLALFCLALSLAPAVRNRSWEVASQWTHWLLFLTWLVLTLVAHWQCARRLPGRDPYLLPLISVLTGWGLLTIYRLYPSFGLRQVAWLAVAIVLLIPGLRLPENLRFLRRYKYLWLTGGLLLTTLTLVFGINPLGYGPKMWLGCCGIYLQPSEPLKLLLITYLAAYLADRLVMPAAQGDITASRPLLPLLAPTLIMTGLAISILAIQRDLGTALILLFLYAVIVYVASGRKRVILIAATGMAFAGLAGYWFFDVVRVRVDAWLNPWADPSGSSYQIVQSLLAVANGGLPGRGPGLGSPGLVPVPHSDFIFTSIAEETGLIGVVALLILLALLLNRGLRTALRAPDAFRRYLAAGLTAYLVGQSILIIGGNIRLLPLTGVTLPFVSYGGSSLVISYLALLLLMIISNTPIGAPASRHTARPYLQLGGLMLAGLAALGLIAGWWAIYRAPDLLTRTDNTRRSISDRYVKRGAILDRQSRPISTTLGSSGAYQREIEYPALSNVIGYINPVYGQTGLEDGLDQILRGLSGNSPTSIWWNHLLFGQPPPGVNIQTSLDLELQRTADQTLQGKHGAIVLLNAKSGEILSMASQPGFDANKLDEMYESLINPDAALLNRTTQGLYPPGVVLGVFMLTQLESQGEALLMPEQLDFQLADRQLECARPAEIQSLTAALQAGCPGATASLGDQLGNQGLLELFTALRIYNPPNLPLPVAGVITPAEISDPAWAAIGQARNADLQNQALRLSPLQMALAAATLSNDGSLPTPQIALAMHTQGSEWTPLSQPNQAEKIFSSDIVTAVSNELKVGSTSYWGVVSTAPNGNDQSITWFVGGAQSGLETQPYSVVVLLEEHNPDLAEKIGITLLEAAQATGY